MKSLRESLFESSNQTTESLFDKDLVSQEHPYEKLLKSTISKNDVLSFIEAWNEGDFLSIKNRNLLEWGKDFYNKEVGDRRDLVLKAGYYTWNVENDITQESFNWLKPGKVHTKVTWNDCMYADTIDVSWGFWGGEDHWDTITEWVLVNKNDRSMSIHGIHTWILVNRKEYDEIDQQIIHKLIKIIAK